MTLRITIHCYINVFFYVFIQNEKGLIVLLGSGVHTVWAFWEVASPSPWLEIEVLAAIGSWYITTIIGTAIAALLLPKWPKKRLYVSISVSLE